MKTVTDYSLPLNSLKDKQHANINTVLFYQVCADTVKAKQSTVQNMGAGYAFFAHRRPRGEERGGAYRGGTPPTAYYLVDYNVHVHFTCSQYKIIILLPFRNIRNSAIADKPRDAFVL